MQNLPQLIKHDEELKKRVHKIELQFGNDKHELWVIERYSLQSTLAYLSTFCHFFVYSHGYKDYIKAILAKIDPESKYFTNLEERLIAPDASKPHERMNMLKTKKQF